MCSIRAIYACHSFAAPTCTLPPHGNNADALPPSASTHDRGCSDAGAVALADAAFTALSVQDTAGLSTGPAASDSGPLVLSVRQSSCAL